MRHVLRIGSLLTLSLTLASAAGAQGAEPKIGPGAVAVPGNVKACEEAANPAAARACLATTLRKLQPEAARFAERLKGEGYLREFSEQGRVDVAYVTYLFRANANDGTLLVNGTPEIVDVNDPAIYKGIDIKADKLYSTLAKDGAIELWADDPGRPLVLKTAEGGQRFEFKLALKTCRACASPGVALIAFDFGATGKFLGTRLIELQAGQGKPFPIAN
jgi:hypothetical protein